MVDPSSLASPVVLTGASSSSTASSSAPNSPARARRLEDYGDSMQMYESPRHSQDSSTSLLHGQHSRASSIGSLDSPYTAAVHNGSGLERSSAIPGLPRLSEEEHHNTLLPSHFSNDHDSQHDDEFPHTLDRRSSLRNKIENDAALGNGHASGKTSRRSTTEGRHRTLSSVSIPLEKVQESASKFAIYLKENRGLLMIAAAQLAFAAMNAMVKIMTSSEVAVPIWELIFTRMSLTWLCCYIYMKMNNVQDPFLGPKGVRGWLTLRGFVGFFGLFGSYFSLQYLSLSDATVLAFLAPTVTGLLAALFLKEPYTLKEAISGFISLGGAVLVAQPSFLFGSLAEEEDPRERMIAVGVALLGVFSASAAYVTIRQIGKKAHALHSVVYFCIGCVFTSPLMPVFIEGQDVVVPYKAIFWVYLTGIGICGFAAQFLMARALQIERVGRALLGNYCQLPFALILQYLIFGEVMDLLSTLGAIIIMGSTCWVVFTRGKDKPEIKHKERALSFSSSVVAGEFAADDNDSDSDDDDERPRVVQAGQSTKYTQLSDTDMDGLEAGLTTTNNLSSAVNASPSQEAQIRGGQASA